MTDHDQLLQVETENKYLKARIQQLEDELSHYRSATDSSNDHSPPPPLTAPTTATLEPSEYIRYGRQLILPQIGLPGQTRLKSTKVLIIGAGGLGCPAATYLAAAGIGTLGLIDHDTVELSNLHRQTLHTTARIGTLKVHSAIAALRERNPHVVYVPHAYALTPENALATVSPYDVVLDCTDHPALRYLVSDACVLTHKPLVSASALRTDGQLIVLNNPPTRAPCYRCIWPRAPPPETVTSCSDGGVLGPVVGVMGVLQALEAVRLIVTPLPADEDRLGHMLFFSAFAETPFRMLRMRGRRRGCVTCADAGSALQDMPEYTAFCGTQGGMVGLEPEKRRRVDEVRGGEGRKVVVDVRDETQFGICRVDGSVNIPFEWWQKCATGCVPEEMVEVLKKEGEEEVVVLCRLGNDSQVAARQILDSGLANGRTVVDVVGGIREWARVAPEDGVMEY